MAKKLADHTRARKASERPQTNGFDRAPLSAVLSQAQISAFQRAFLKDPKNRLARNAVTRNPALQVALNRETVSSLTHTFSHVVKTGDATSQMRSGRCWLFAGLNTMRTKLIGDLKLKPDFELSQSYLMFWDKLEKANFFLESILETADEPVGSRLLDWLLTDPVQDGGQWDMFLNLVEKYGVVPKSAMPEAESSGNSGAMNTFLTSKLREFAIELRDRVRRGDSKREIRRRKREMLETVYRVLAIHLGNPPTQFYWQWRDRSGRFHRRGWITPQEFFVEYCADAVEDKICLIHCPQPSKEFHQLYTIQYLGNVLGGRKIRYLNVEIELLKQTAIAMIKKGEPVWFGCDVGKGLERELGILDTEVYDFDALYGCSIQMDKAGRLDYRDSMMNHAMVFAGVNLDEDGKPTAWRVENSWGQEGGDKGYLVMSDRWFDEYVYEVAVDVRLLPKSLQPVLEREPIPLPPWDPMGALAIQR
jgi:bleomycin hydrolase